MAERRSRRWGWPSFIALLLVLGVSLAVGSGIASGPPSDVQRAAAIDARLRCPQCEDESVAQSAASSAIAVRHQVAEMVAAGRTDHQIEQYFVARYGPDILLAPPTTGLASLVWYVPAAAGALVLAAVGWLFWRRSRAFERLGRAR